MYLCVGVRCIRACLVLVLALAVAVAVAVENVMVDGIGIVVRFGGSYIYCLVGDDLELVLCSRRREDNEGYYGHC